VPGAPVEAFDEFGLAPEDTDLWLGIEYPSHQEVVEPETHRPGRLLVQTAVEGPRWLRPLYRRMGRHVALRLVDFQVDPEYRGRGIGSALLDAALRAVPATSVVDYAVRGKSELRDWSERHGIGYHPFQGSGNYLTTSPDGSNESYVHYRTTAAGLVEALHHDRTRAEWLEAGTGQTTVDVRRELYQSSVADTPYWM